VWRLLKELCSTVSNKVVLGDLESEWFTQDNDVKQGCICSPSLFSVMMKDLTDMLSEHNIGVPIASQIINALLYADDVALMTESESDLQTMLNIASSFTMKWNLKFNSNKSKVLVEGKRINKSNKWVLGDTYIEETNEYKYLGVYLSRSLKPTQHIGNHIKDKLNGMIRILGKHGNFNRIEFSSALWNSVLRPTAAYGCSIWFPSSAAQKDLLESLQYQAAKITIRTKMNIPKCALLAELGLEPINAFLVRQRVSFSLRLTKISNNRPSKVVFHELSRFKTQNAEWPYFSYIRTLFEYVGLPHFIEGNFKINTFNRFFWNE